MRKQRKTGQKMQNVENWLHWQNWGCLLGRYGEPQNWGGQSPVEFWQENREAIIAYFPEWQQQQGSALFWRPDSWMAEIETQHKRKIKKYETWHSAHTGAGPGEWRRDAIYESDEQLLTRLGLLTDFEKRAGLEGIGRNEVNSRSGPVEDRSLKGGRSQD
jgi:hypothetical protein